MRCPYVLAAGVSVLLGVGPAFPDEPPADVVADLERQTRTSWWWRAGATHG